MPQKLITIAGPCAAESETQIDIAIEEALKRSISFLRVNLWKPRTRPGFDGLGEEGLPLLTKVAQAGLNPSLEVVIPEHASLAAEAVLPYLPTGGKLLLWIGSRNQNHYIQKDIARFAAQDTRIHLMVKNQPWPSEDHWEGIIEHVLSTGFPAERLISCCRGFTPCGDNPFGLRNIPDFEMAMRIRGKSGIPMVFDPSHTGGNVPNVLRMGEMAAKHNFDGVVVEVHHDPPHALTDQKQQLTWPQFDLLMTTLLMDNTRA